MTEYRNKEGLKKTINEGFLNVNSYEKASYKELLLEKILNMAKNERDVIFSQLKTLVEEVVEDEKELSQKVDVDKFVNDAQSDEYMKSSTVDNLPMTTLAVKKLDNENIESLKWLLVKKTEGTFSKNKIFDLSDSEFKKMLCTLIRNETDEELVDNEEHFTDKAIEDNTVEPLVESFIKFVGQTIKEEMETDTPNDDNDYYYLVKKQLDTIGDDVLKEKIHNAYETVSYDSMERDPMDLVDNVPVKIKDKVQLAYIKNSFRNGLDFEDKEENQEEDLMDTNEDEEFAALADEDSKLSDVKMSLEEQIARQEMISEELKQLYIIKKTKDMIMLESSYVLKDIHSKRKLLNRALMYEEALGNKENKAYCEKLMKVNTLVECLVRKYLPVILE